MQPTNATLAVCNALTRVLKTFKNRGLFVPYTGLVLGLEGGKFGEGGHGPEGHCQFVRTHHARVPAR